MFILIFEQESLSFNLLDVVILNQGEVNTYNSGRHFDAISFRIKSDTVIKTENDTFVLKDNSVCYGPAMVNYTRTSKHDYMIVVHFNSINYSSKNIEVFYPENPEPIKALFFEIYDCWTKKETGYRHRSAAILNLIFAEIYKRAHIKKEINPKIKNSVTYITENYMKSDISITKVAEYSNMSEVYFRKLFKKEFGISPKKYIIDARIKLAESLIESGYYSLYEVSEKCGFSDYKYFSTEFKKITGSSPSDYSYNFKI